MLFSCKQFFLAGMYGCIISTGVLAFSDEVFKFLFNCFSYINKTLIYSLIICANVVFYNPLHGAPTFSVGGDKAHDILEEENAFFFLFHCARAFKPKKMIDLGKEIV